jgi:predicted MFS family arabinose efflux permease
MANQSVTIPAQTISRQLALQIMVATLSRLVLNTSRRFIYPFAPALGRGLGVPVQAINSLIAINQATGVLSPFFGPLSDRWGYRVMMLAGLSMLAVGLIAGGVLPFYAVILVALFLAGLGKSIFDPALQAYVGERVPYQRRGFVIGIVEFAWAGSSLVGLPLIGILIDTMGWQAPFFVLGGLTVLCTIGLALVMPGDNGRQVTPRARKGLAEIWRGVSQSPAALWGLAFGFWISLANDNLYVVLGLWLESFGLSLTGVGLAASIIGVGELFGEALTAFWADRIGLSRALIIGLILTALSYLLLPFLSLNLTLALASLFLVFLFFEFSIVTSLSLYTEVLPEARATMMSSFIAALGAGRVVGALLGGWVWSSGGLAATALFSAVATGLSLLCLWQSMRARAGHIKHRHSTLE